MVSGLFGLAAFILMARVVKRRANRDAVYLFAILTVLNMSYAFDTSIVKTQSLCILIYAGALAVAIGGRMTVAQSDRVDITTLRQPKARQYAQPVK
jgi:predicted membrane-bound mannosyltransferase